MTAEKKALPGKYFFSFVTFWLFLLFFTSCFLLIYYTTDLTRIKQDNTTAFSEKSGSDLIITSTRNADNRVDIGNMNFLPVIDLHYMAEDLSVTTFLSSLQAVEYFYPLSLTACTLYINKAHPFPVRLYGISTADLPLFMHVNQLMDTEMSISVMENNSLQVQGLLVPRELAKLAEAVYGNMLKIGDKLLLIKNPDTYLDAVSLPVAAIIDITGIALFTDHATFQTLAPVYNEPAAQAATVLPADRLTETEAYTKFILNPAFPVKNTNLSDDFFFKVFPDPDNTGILPQVDPHKYHFLVVKTREKEKVSGLLEAFFADKQLPLSVMYGEKTVKAIVIKDTISLIDILIILCACFSIIFLMLYLYRSIAKKQNYLPGTPFSRLIISVILPVIIPVILLFFLCLGNMTWRNFGRMLLISSVILINGITFPIVRRYWQSKTKEKEGTAKQDA